MAYIHSLARALPEFSIQQNQIQEFARSVFEGSNLDLNRLLPVFKNSIIEKRPVLKDMEWYSKSKSFKEKNQEFLENSLILGKLACERAILKANLSPKDIDGFIVVTSSGFVTPTLDARLIDILNLREDILRMPLTGLGCAGGAYGLARANDLSKIYPDKNILVLAVETCTLTFRPDDKRKANLIALSLFSDGACALVLNSKPKANSIQLLGSHSYKWKNSLNVMGWDVEQDGLQVIFDKSIPSLINKNYLEIFSNFINLFKLNNDDIIHFLYHPGGKKVLDAFKSALNIEEEKLSYSTTILKNHGNMSSPTVLFVIDEFIESKNFQSGEKGIIGAMGPGFTSESLLFETT